MPLRGLEMAFNIDSEMDLIETRIKLSKKHGDYESLYEHYLKALDQLQELSASNSRLRKHINYLESLLRE